MERHFKSPIIDLEQEHNELNEFEQHHPSHPELPVPVGDAEHYIDILRISDQRQRISEILGFDTGTQQEELEVFQEVFAESMQLPFDAVWRDPDENYLETALSVVGIREEFDPRRGILLRVEIREPSGAVRKRYVVADQIYITKQTPTNEEPTKEPIKEPSKESDKKKKKNKKKRKNKKIKKNTNKKQKKLKNLRIIIIDYLTTTVFG